MSLINQPIIRNGIFVKPISNRLSITTGAGASFNNVMSMGGANISNSFCSYNGSKIIINKTSKYKISFSFYSNGLASYSFGGYCSFELSAGLNTIGKLSGFNTGTIESDNFGRSSFYIYPNASVTNTNLSASGSFNWTGLLNKSVDLNLSSGDEIFLNFQASNLIGTTHFASAEGFLFIEEIS
jgi:hypothetical protein